MSAARVVPDAPAPAGRRLARAQRIVACALALSLLASGVRTARAAGEDGSPDSRVGVIMAVVCGFALKFAIPSPVPWAGIAAAACGFAFLDALAAPDNPAPAPDPRP
jgi:hypothetical protein